MTDAARLRSRLAEGMSPARREDFLAVPRHLFAPERIWVRDGDGGTVALDRSENPQGWLAACYEDRPLGVQFDDGHDTGRGYCSSSASMPSVMASMLDAADLEPGHRVLEVGTGTGFNAALMASRVGVRNVTTVEIDRGLANLARSTLRLNGWPVRVVSGDGTLGYPSSGPFHRVMSTAAVQEVPYAWVEQTVAGGLIVTPWGTALHNGALLRLRVEADGTASGNFGGDVSFMWVRGQRTPHGAVEDRVLPEHDHTASVTALHPHTAVGDFDASFAVGLLVPEVKSTTVFDRDDPTTSRYTVYLMDPRSGSWASWRVEPGSEEFPVRQHGPRKLFDEVESAYRWWVGRGRPEHSRFGVTVDREGQHVWLDDPGDKVDAPH
ncbi:rRNA adenine N-6-methyltransferase family protein [Nocardiopsis sp. NPDC006938]|uniref:rRNA adenine N-6-methyltransferase family protein n=1 Tax=Nocardiopsis sp. NPDC006938 TaxID=3364337 RepID=UPI0036C45F51